MTGRGKNEIDGRVELDGVEHIFEVKRNLHAARGLRAALMNLAYAAARLPSARGHLVLADSMITIRRLEAEWDAARTVLSPELRERLDILVHDDETGETIGIPRQPEARVLSFAKTIVAEEDRGGVHLPRPDFTFETLKYLLIRWLKCDGAIPVLGLIKGIGYSFPTASRILRELDSEIIRHSDRSVELRGFPARLWSFAIEWIPYRHSVRFSDRSGKPRSPEQLLSRLRKLNRTDIAIGGVEASQWWLPELDLTGSPRLDLVVHCPERRLDLDFVNRLDPALRQIHGRDQAESLVVHALQRREPCFSKRSGDTIADPVECLLDLHEMRLENQADALIKGLRARFAAK